MCSHLGSLHWSISKTSPSTVCTPSVWKEACCMRSSFLTSTLVLMQCECVWVHTCLPTCLCACVLNGERASLECVWTERLRPCSDAPGDLLAQHVQPLQHCKHTKAKFNHNNKQETLDRRENKQRANYCVFHWWDPIQGLCWDYTAYRSLYAVNKTFLMPQTVVQSDRWMDMHRQTE